MTTRTYVSTRSTPPRKEKPTTSTSPDRTTPSPEGRSSPNSSKVYHPLLHLLRITITEAYRYHKSRSAPCSHDNNLTSIKSVLQQVDFLWDALEGTQMEKYEFIRSRLSLIMLWQGEGQFNGVSFTRSIMNPPMHMSDVNRSRRRQTLMAIRPGELFVAA